MSCPSDYFIFKILKIRWTANSLVLQTQISLAIALPPVAPSPTAIMSHQTPPPSFWADKRLRWIARARAFNVAEAASAVTALNAHIGSSSGALSQEKVTLVQGSGGLFEWTASSLALLRQMGEDVSILDDIGRTTAASSPLKGTPPSPPPYSPPPPPTFGGGMSVRPARVSGHGRYCHSGGMGRRRCGQHAARPTTGFRAPRCIRGWTRTYGLAWGSRLAAVARPTPQSGIRPHISPRFTPLWTGCSGSTAGGQPTAATARNGRPLEPRAPTCQPRYARGPGGRPWEGREGGCGRQPGGTYAGRGQPRALYSRTVAARAQPRRTSAR